MKKLFVTLLLLVPLCMSAATGHKATLSWTASPVATQYNVYRSATSGSGYVMIATIVTPGTTPPTSYVDSSVVEGQTYFWVVTVADASGQESAYSNEVTATIPIAPTAPAGLTVKIATVLK